MPGMKYCPNCGSNMNNDCCILCGYRVSSYSPVRTQTLLNGNPVDETGRQEGATVFSQSVPYIPSREYKKPLTDAGQQAYQQNYQQPDTYYADSYSNNKESYDDDEKIGRSGNTTLVIGGVFAAVLLVVCLVVLVTQFNKSKSTVYQTINDASTPVVSINPGNGSGTGNGTGTSTSVDNTERYGNLNYNLSAVLAENESVVDLDTWQLLGADPYEGDPKYYNFEDYIDATVKYKVERGCWGYFNDGGQYDSDGFIYPHGVFLFADYVRVSDTGLSFEQEINKKIYEKTLEISDMAEKLLYLLDEEYVAYAECSTYVSYMDDEVLSLLMQCTAYMVSDYGTGDQLSTSQYAFITSINFDMKTGLEIKASETFDFSGDFYQTFKDTCNTQNGSPVDYYDDAVLSQYLCDDKMVVWAYTPIGLEVGINRTGYSGWSTCSFTDPSVYYKEY